MLGKPNQLSGIPALYRDKALFECPMACGWVDMTIDQLDHHCKNVCDLREFDTKEAIFMQSNVLQRQIDNNDPYYSKEIAKMKSRI